MLELRTSEATVVHCLAQPASLDELPAIERSDAYRVAPDELILLASGRGRADLLEAASSALGSKEPGGLTVDMSDGWAILSIVGTGFEAVLTRLSAIAPPPSRPAFLQGAVAEVPAKTIVLDKVIHVMVAATVEHQLRDRIRSACADLDVREFPPAPLTSGPA